MIRSFCMLACIAALAAPGCRGKGLDKQPPAEASPVEKAAPEAAGEAPEPDQPAKEPQIPGDKEELVLKLGKGTMPPVSFPHLEHVEDSKVACRTCHHPEGEIQACTQCHKKAAQPGGAKSFMDAAHKSCIGCHKQQGGPTACAQCHAS
jgi:hypothetical protein